MKNIRHPQVLDIKGNLIAILDKSYKIGYTKVKNGLWTCSFSMPLHDSKVIHIQPKYHIELYDHDKRIGRFIVNPKNTTKNESTREITFQCEHVLSTLHSDILFRYHQYSNFNTKQVIEFLLDSQEVKHWKVGTVEISRNFHYSWENEDSLLNATMSITKPFNVPFLWTWDDSTYPFTLNLVNPPNDIKDVIAAGKNLKGVTLEEDPTNIVTRIYPLGAGEGINQLDITKVNGGIPYLQDDAAVAKYGIHKRVWVDSRFEDAPSLKASSQGILDKFKEPITTCAIDAIDYTLKDLYNLDGYTVADMLQVFDLDTSTDTQLRVEKLSKSDVYGQPYAITLELGNRIEDIGMTFSDLQKKQLVNDTYSQGATNIDSRDFVGECDQNYPAVIRFHIPDDVVNINSMLLTFETQKYRAYSKAVEGGGATVVNNTSSSGGSVAQVTKSSASGGSTASKVESSSTADDHVHALFSATGFSQDPNPASNVILTCRNGLAIYAGGQTGAGVTYYTEGAAGKHSHTVPIPATPGHTHELTIPAIPGHTHAFKIDLPDHTHPLKHGIFEYEKLPTAVQIIVDGKTLPLTAIKGDSIDLLPYLQKDADGKVSRGRYAEVRLAPNDLARINATVTSRLFIQSRIGTVM